MKAIKLKMPSALDGRILIGKVYGHLAKGHAQAQASKLSFVPPVLEVVES